MSLAAIDGKALAEFHAQHLTRWEEARKRKSAISRKRTKADGSVSAERFALGCTMLKRPGPNGRAHHAWLSCRR